MRSDRAPIWRLALIAVAAVLIHGYHLGVDDAGIYVPAIKKVADPQLYGFGSQFFMSHAHLSMFSGLIGDSARLTHIPINFTIFLWYAGGIFLLLLASWRLLSLCFAGDRARWGGVALLAAVLTLPVAGTALAIVDPYLTARSLSTPMFVFAVACFLAGENWGAVAWLAGMALIHPQMACYGSAFLVCLWFTNRARQPKLPAPAVLALATPFVFDFVPPIGPAREALLSRTYFFISNWTWYEWIGIVAPLVLAWWISAHPPPATRAGFKLALRAVIPFGILFTLAALILTFPPSLENFTRLQPMRAFHPIYLIFFLMLGGLLGEYVLRGSVLRWLALFTPLAVSMWLVQLSAFPSSSHVEWPGIADRNTWNTAFVWIRDHTPKNAVFALGSDYLHDPGEDMQGFRAIAERSALADGVKDSGAVSLFPQLAVEWKAEVNAQRGWSKFRLLDFRTLAKEYPVTWIVTQRPAPRGLACPYRDGNVAVCRIDSAAP